ncbi:dTMP kinase [Mycoplasmopsis meleagridis]|uniref:dTMP kinase n=1 Tax=Mycoplasmopsis meleagridis TaxID=29561 RepID=UPI003A89C036
MFITFEGLDGSGKTTVIKLLAEKFKNTFKNINIITTREPGGQGIKEAEKIREIILSKESDISPITEAMLYSASRRIHLDKVVIPALKENKIVLCDRYIDSFYAYQGYARNLGIDFVKNLTSLVVQNLMPDITFFLNLSLEQSKERREKSRNIQSLNRLDIESDNFYKKVYDGYQELIKNEPKRFIVIDSNKKIDYVVNEIFNIIINHQLFKKHYKID